MRAESCHSNSSPQDTASDVWHPAAPSQVQKFNWANISTPSGRTLFCSVEPRPLWFPSFPAPPAHISSLYYRLRICLRRWSCSSLFLFATRQCLLHLGPDHPPSFGLTKASYRARGQAKPLDLPKIPTSRSSTSGPLRERPLVTWRSAGVAALMSWMVEV
jgi:hypothetical protein